MNSFDGPMAQVLLLIDARWPMAMRMPIYDFVSMLAWRTSLTFQKKVKIEADASDVSTRVNAQARSKHAIYAGGAIRYHSYVMISQIHGRPTNTSKSRTPLWWWTAVTSSSAHTTRTVRHVLRQRR